MKYGKILLVDDSATSRLIVRRCFEMTGYADAEITECSDGGVALDLLRTGDFDLVVTDLKMPRVDGITLVRRMRGSEYAANVPVVVISSVAEASINDPMLQDNVIAVIQKPVSPAKLMHAFKEEP